MKKRQVLFFVIAIMLSVVTVGVFSITASAASDTSYHAPDTLKAFYYSDGDEARKYILGDLNGDEVITVDDAIYLAFYTFYPDRYSIPNGMNVNFNNEGEVTIDDAIYLAFYTFYPDKYPIVSPDSYYTITWENGDGTVLKTTQCEADTMPSFGNTNPSKASDSQYDYIFSSWSPEVKIATEDTTYMAVYTQSTRSSYTITYNANGGTNAPAAQGKTRGTSITLSSSVPNNSGYDFCGWLCVNDGKTYAAGSTFSLDADAKLYALWGNTCSTCAGVGTTSSTGDCKTCGGDGKVIEETYTNAICSNCSGLGDFYSNCSSCKGFGKIGTCYCSCGNTWSPNTTGSRVCSKCGTSVAMSIAGTCGWCQGKGGSMSSCYRCGGDGVMAVPNGSTSVTCSGCRGSGLRIYTTTCSTCSGNKAIVENTTYTITLKDGSSTISTVSVTLKSSYSLPVPTKNGYTFLGWFDALENGTQYANAFGIPMSVWLDFSDKTFYARWRKNCDVTLTQNISEAGTVNGSGNYSYGSSVTVEATTNTGYTFLGWYANDTLISSSARYTFTVSGDKTIEGRWGKNPDVTLTQNIAEAGSVSGGGNYVYGASVTVAATTNKGYTFLGWYENDSLLSSSESFTFTVSDSITLTAKWIKIYDILLTQNIPSAGTVTGSGNYDAGTSVTITATTNKGCMFVGWYEKDKGDNEEFNLISTNETYTFEVSSDRTITARYELNEEYVGLEDYYFDISWYGCEITGVIAKTKTEYIIPDCVTNIGSKAFSECTSLTSITIPDSVRSIGAFAFEGCTSLASITIPNSVTYIGGSAFEGCTSLTSITIPDSVTSIDNDAFKGCTSLASITIPNSVTSIGGSAFEGCTNLTSITIPDSVRSIGAFAFEGCTSLTSITIPNSVTDIGRSAFRDCTSLTNITLPDSVTSIGSYAFEGCTGFTNITLPDSVTSIESHAFEGCTSLTSITILDSVTSIGDQAFCDCTSLTNITLPDSLTSIGWGTFYGCTSLTSITIPNSVTSIGGAAFSGCGILTSITIPDGITNIGELTFSSCSNLTNIMIPDSVTSIGYYAFSNCTSLANIIIPDNVTSIGNSAFLRCTSLTSITLPDGVTRIASSAFEGCTSLTSITIPNSVTSIGESAFESCTSLISITIPNGVTSIERNAFYLCHRLFEVINHSSLDFTIGSTSNGYIAYYAKEIHTGESKFANQNGFIFYTQGTVNYLCAYVGSETELLLPQSYNGKTYEIAPKAFYECSNLTNVMISDGVTKIGGAAFAYCDNLTKVSIGNSVTAIDKEAFYITGLTSIVIPDSVKTIGGSAFSQCPNLTDVTIGEGVTSIGGMAFYMCENLKNINYCGTEWQWDEISKGTAWAHFYWYGSYISLEYTMTYNYTGN